MYVGKSPIGNRSVSDLAIWGARSIGRSLARPLTRCFVRVCVCVLMLAEWDKGGRRCSGGQAKTQADPRLLNLNGNSYRIYSLSTPSPFPSRLPLWLKITLGRCNSHRLCNPGPKPKAELTGHQCMRERERERGTLATAE